MRPCLDKSNWQTKQEAVFYPQTVCLATCVPCYIMTLLSSCLPCPALFALDNEATSQYDACVSGQINDEFSIAMVKTWLQSQYSRTGCFNISVCIKMRCGEKEQGPKQTGKSAAVPACKHERTTTTGSKSLGQSLENKALQVLGRKQMHERRSMRICPHG